MMLNIPTANPPRLFVSEKQSRVIDGIVINRVCAITNCEITSPHPERPNEGLFVIHVILTPMGGREFEARSFILYHL